MPKTVRPDRPTKLGFQRNANGVDTSAHLIYRLWMLPEGGEELTFYVGRSLRSKRPFDDYDDNVRRMLEGRQPRNGGPIFRAVIWDLMAAYRAGHRIGIELVGNIADPHNKSNVEKHCQAAYGVRGKIRMLDDDARPLPDFLERRSAAPPLSASVFLQQHEGKEQFRAVMPAGADRPPLFEEFP